MLLFFFLVHHSNNEQQDFYNLESTDSDRYVLLTLFLPLVVSLLTGCTEETPYFYPLFFVWGKKLSKSIGCLSFILLLLDKRQSAKTDLCQKLKKSTILYVNWIFNTYFSLYCDWNQWVVGKFLIKTNEINNTYFTSKANWINKKLWRSVHHVVFL